MSLMSLMSVNLALKPEDRPSFEMSPSEINTEGDGVPRKGLKAGLASPALGLQIFMVCA